MDRVVIDGGPVWLLMLAMLIQAALTIGFLVWWAATMSRALKACSYQNRQMDPGSAWLILIPVFGLIWQFIAVKKTSESLAQEYHHRAWQSDEGRPGIEIGMITCGVIIIVVLLRILIIDLNPGLSFFATLAICICIYMHRERLIAFTERLEQSNRETPMFYVFEQYNNPFAVPQQQHFAKPSQQTAESPQVQEEFRAPGWDGVSVWTPPSDWKEPDLSDPRPWFS